IFQTGFRSILIEKIVVGPELSLFVGTARRLMPSARAGMKAIDGKVAKDNFHFIVIFGFDLRERRKRPLAEGTMKVSKLDHRDWRFSRAFERRSVSRHVDALDRRGFKVHHHLRPRS